MEMTFLGNNDRLHMTAHLTRAGSLAGFRLRGRLGDHDLSVIMVSAVGRLMARLALKAVMGLIDVHVLRSPGVLMHHRDLRRLILVAEIAGALPKPLCRRGSLGGNLPGTVVVLALAAVLKLRAAVAGAEVRVVCVVAVDNVIVGVAVLRVHLGRIGVDGNAVLRDHAFYDDRVVARVRRHNDRKRVGSRAVHRVAALHDRHFIDIRRPHRVGGFRMHIVPLITDSAHIGLSGKCHRILVVVLKLRRLRIRDVAGDIFRLSRKMQLVRVVHNRTSVMLRAAFYAAQDALCKTLRALVLLVEAGAAGVAEVRGVVGILGAQIIAALRGILAAINAKSAGVAVILLILALPALRAEVILVLGILRAHSAVGASVALAAVLAETAVLALFLLIETDPAFAAEVVLILGRLQAVLAAEAAVHLHGRRAAVLTQTAVIADIQTYCLRAASAIRADPSVALTAEYAVVAAVLAELTEDTFPALRAVNSAQLNTVRTVSAEFADLIGLAFTAKSAVRHFIVATVFAQPAGHAELVGIIEEAFSAGVAEELFIGRAMHRLFVSAVLRTYIILSEAMPVIAVGPRRHLTIPAQAAGLANIVLRAADGAVDGVLRPAG